MIMIARWDVMECLALSGSFPCMDRECWVPAVNNSFHKKRAINMQLNGDAIAASIHAHPDSSVSDYHLMCIQPLAQSIKHLSGNKAAKLHFSVCV